MMNTQVLLVVLVLGIAFFTYRKVASKQTSPDLPHVQQEPLSKRLLVEPSPPQVEAWARQIPNDGLLQYYGILGKKRILATSPKAIHDILQTQTYSYVKPPAISKILKSVLGEGLVVAEGDQHRVQRKMLQPAMRLRSVKDVYPLFWAKTVELIEVLTKASSEGDPVDILDYTSRVTLDIIANGGFDLDVNSLADPTTPFYTQYTTGFMPSPGAQAYRMLALILPEWALDVLPLKRNQELRSSVRAVGDAILKKVAEDEKSALVSESRKDILSVLKKEGGQLDKKLLVDQGLTFLGAGHDTIAQSLNWGVYELCANPTLQARLHEEAHQQMPDMSSSSAPDASTLDRIETMPLMTAFCNEVLRLHPPIHHLHREAIQPVIVDGRELPKGSSFIISIGSMNRSPDLWKSDPSKFDPERWLDDPTGGAKERQAFSSFSEGPRSCIGERFGRAEMAFILAGLVANLKMSFEDGAENKPALEYGTTTRFEGTLLVKVKPVPET